MTIGMSARNHIATFFKYAVLIAMGFVMIYPLLWMVSATFKDNNEIFSGISLWIKQHLFLRAPQGPLYGALLHADGLRVRPVQL